MQNYPLGYSALEARRLADQAAQVEEHTEDVLRRAGLRRGMRVLDLGCGVGDVSLLAARITGSDGAVLGVDKGSSSLEIARGRVATLGMQHVSFEQGDVCAFTTDEKFDAIVGRFVLSYVPDRIEALRRLTSSLNPGALVVFLELDMSQLTQVPASALFEKARRWLLDAFAAGGAELDMGTKLYTTFLRAGLPAPNMLSATPVVGGAVAAPPGYDQLVEALRSLLPTITRAGIATTEEIDIDTLAERLRADAIEQTSVLFMSRIVSAWSRLP